MGTNEKEKIVSHNVMVLLRVSRDPRPYKMPLCFYSEHNLACGHSKVSNAKVNYKSHFFRWLNWITLKISPKTPALPTKTPIRGNFRLSLKEKKSSGKKNPMGIKNSHVVSDINPYDWQKGMSYTFQERKEWRLEPLLSKFLVTPFSSRFRPHLEQSKWWFI